MRNLVARLRGCEVPRYVDVRGHEHRETAKPRDRVNMTIVLMAAFCLLPSALWACPVCFGDSTSALNKGASNGILFLLGVIGMVQIGFIALFWSFWRRARALRARREQFQLIDGGLP